METTYLYDASLLCLDLVNTRIVQDGAPVDLLTGFDGLVGWLEGAGVLDADGARAARSRWGGTAEGEAAFRRALELRDAVLGMADAMIAGQAVRDADVAALNAVLAEAPVATRVVRREGGFAREAHPAASGPAGLLAPVADSAVALLTELDPARVGQCGSPTCILYFYDVTKNRGRRWCSMDRCGSRAKSAAYYRRRHPHDAPE
ncbi:MAG TPA: ABATE domain-containing protein [Longimicrobium sp.]|nr:ABATE domain-containing protein [Longimicrobium sp.]